MFEKKKDYPSNIHQSFKRDSPVPFGSCEQHSDIYREKKHFAPAKTGKKKKQDTFDIVLVRVNAYHATR